LIFVGDDWASDHHDVHVMDAEGERLAARRLPEGLDGIEALQALVAGFEPDPSQVAVGIETDRGMWVAALAAAGYLVYPINPLAASRYRDRHRVSGAKSDAGDAKTLADLVRTDRHNHRPMSADSELVKAVEVLARTHKDLIGERTARVNELRAVLSQYFPAALTAFGKSMADNAGDVAAVLSVAASPRETAAVEVAALVAALRAAGRSQKVDERAARILAGLRAGRHLSAPGPVAAAFAVKTRALAAQLATLEQQIKTVHEALRADFNKHPDAGIYLSIPGFGDILGARVLGEFGDDPDSYTDAKCRKNYAGTSPLTIASGRKRTVHARYIRNTRLYDALDAAAFSALQSSPGARALYKCRRAAGDLHHQALRAVANRFVGILHGCLRHHALYDEHTAWSHRSDTTIHTPATKAA
jgi:transposase